MEEAKKERSITPDFNQLELGILDFWEKEKIFEKSLEQTKGNPPYVFYDGPPFATGLPHYGHILASVIKDTVGRYQTMKGRYVRRVWGWDCHGLPIENIVEQKLGISGKKQIEEIGVEKFNEACRENVLKFVDDWGKTVKRIGRWVDFEHSYKTMDTTYMESVWRGIKEMWDKELIYEDRKVLLYCSRCETPISNFEVAMDNSYREINEVSVFAKFKLTPRQRIIDFLTDENTFVLAWTTTPWTLPGNTSLNVGPDITYVMVSQGENKFILDKERLEILDGEYSIVKEFAARSLIGLTYEPLFSEFIEHVGNAQGLAHRILSADFVTTTDGTGVVHNAAMYGEEDYQLAKEKGLPREPMLDNKGHYLPFMGEKLSGKFFKGANRVVLDDLTERGLVYKEENYLHSYPFCWRCGTQLYYNAIPAWFINIQKIKPELKRLNEEQINWYPAHLKHGRFEKGIESAPDWNISRNRYWATALPFWKCRNKECRNVVCIGSIEELKAMATNFSEVYPDYNPTDISKLDIHKPYVDRVTLSCSDCRGVMERIPEVVDCWVESGSMPFAELHAPFQNVPEFEERRQADFVVEYIAQTRAWFYVMHVVSTALFGHAPFKNVLTTGNILAEDGSKMSKSKNNFPDPQIVIEKYGVDAIRFYLLTSSVLNGDDANFSEVGVQDVNRKMNLLLYNILTFYRTYTTDKVNGEQIPEAAHVLDKWALAKFAKVQTEVFRDFEKYDLVKAGKTLVEWVNEFSTWYVRRSRERLKEEGSASKSALAVYGYLLAGTAKLLAPFMPFLSEHIYRDVTGEESVHLAKLIEPPIAELNPDLLEQMDMVREVVSIGHAIRKEQKLSVRQPLSAIHWSAKEKVLELAPELLSIILEELNVKTVVAEGDITERAEGGESSGGQYITSVVLEKQLTDQLRAEGLARELERQVQDLRKKSGLKVGELVDVYYNTTDPELEKALLELVDRKKTFVNQIKLSYEVEVDFEIQADIGEKAIWLGMMKV